MEISLKKIENLLREALNIQMLEVVDESAQHAGHLAMQNNALKTTHVCIKIESLDLEDLSRVQQHRRMYDALRPLIDAGLHAVRFQIL